MDYDDFKNGIEYFENKCMQFGIELKKDLAKVNQQASNYHISFHFILN